MIGNAERYAKEGLIDIQIAKKLGIGETTFYEYQDQYPEFREAIKRGKAESDQEIIESIRKRAIGYDVEETVIETRVGQTRQEGENLGGDVTVVRKHKRHIPASDTAAIFWLKNRQPEHFRDVRQIEGNLGGAVVIIADDDTKRTLDGITELGTKSPKDSND